VGKSGSILLDFSQAPKEG